MSRDDSESATAARRAAAAEPAHTAVRRGAVLLAVEGVALLVVGVIDGIATAVGSPTNRGLSFTIAGFAVAAAGILLMLGRAVGRCRGWARTPAMVLQLLAFPVAVGLLQGRIWAAGTPILLLAGATLWHLVAAGPAFAPQD